MQFSTLNAYPSAVPVPKEIFADVLHAVPVAASITILVGNYVLLGFFKVLQHTVRIVLKCTLDVAEWSELRHVAWAYRNARDDYTRTANRMRVAWEAVLLLVSERLSC